MSRVPWVPEAWQVGRGSKDRREHVVSRGWWDRRESPDLPDLPVSRVSLESRVLPVPWGPPARWVLPARRVSPVSRGLPVSRA